ncbi:EAL domain-containing protein [Vibrio sp. HN007]|uniref:bifunctional diguanylate cyclase/phosphodiesterase n=1 Tax=Vibrio iocasae TaxID=3098914 RepID=UPI0035D4D0AD
MHQLKSDIFESNQSLTELIEIQQDVIAKIALGSNLKETLHQICLGIEDIFSTSEAKSSVLLLEGVQLRDGAAPSLPREYVRLIDGIKIGANVGSCGTAAFCKRRYIASDTTTDGNWSNYQELVEGFNLKACWSTPIISSDDEVLGTFAVYYSIPRTPSDAELKVIDRFTHLTGLAIEKDRAFKRERELHSQLKYSLEKVQAITRVLPDLALIYDEHANYIDSYGSHSQWHLVPSGTTCGNLKTKNKKYSEYLTVQDAITRTLQYNQMHIFEYEIATDDSVRYFESRVTPVQEYISGQDSKSYVLWMARDITARIKAETEIKNLAYKDPLTGLPNRRFLLEKLQNVMNAKADNQLVGALLYLDFDNFKSINDSMGHSVGDILLTEVGQRLSSQPSTTETVCRIGGDEFVILMSQHSDDEEEISLLATNMAQEILNTLDLPFNVGNRDLQIEASIGITLIGSEETHADEVLMRADTAMYSAKRNSEQRICFFDPRLHESLKRRIELESDLESAIKNREIETHFQPKVSINGDIIGAEALVRWFHPAKGPVSPVEFIAIAEEVGIIDGLQKIVVEDTCQLLNKLSSQVELNPKFKLSINVSAEQFKNTAFVCELRQLFSKQKVLPQQITLELTESMLIEDISSVEKQMTSLKSLGFDLSIDDFGTGYSSLAYLQTFPIDELKIDKSFVDNMLQKKVGTGIVDTIIALANHMKYKVVAEGVEIQEQVDYFKQKKINSMQGYHFAKPMPEKQFIEWMKTKE